MKTLVLAIGLIVFSGCFAAFVFSQMGVDDSKYELITSQQTLIDALKNEIAAKDNLISEQDKLIATLHEAIGFTQAQQ